MAQALVEFALTPMRPNVEVALGLTLQTIPPRDAHSVGLLVNPNIDRFEERRDIAPGLEQRQFVRGLVSHETVTLRFDLRGTRAHTIEIGSRRVTIEIMAIGQTPPEGGQRFPTYTFNVMESE